MSLEHTIPGTLSWSPVQDPGKYEALVSPHLKLLRGWVVSRVQKNQDAEEVVQETILLGFRHMGQFRFEASFGTWLCQIAVNVIHGLSRQPGYSRIVLVDLQDPHHSPLADLERRERNTALYRAISKLPKLYRTVVELRDLQERSEKETASSLRITRAAVKARHHRARSLLVKLIRGRATGNVMLGVKNAAKSAPNLNRTQHLTMVG